MKNWKIILFCGILSQTLFPCGGNSSSNLERSDEEMATEGMTLDEEPESEAYLETKRIKAEWKLQFEQAEEAEEGEIVEAPEDRVALVIYRQALREWRNERNIQREIRRVVEGRPNRTSSGGGGASDRFDSACGAFARDSQAGSLPKFNHGDSSRRSNC